MINSADREVEKTQLEETSNQEAGQETKRKHPEDSLTKTTQESEEQPDSKKRRKGKKEKPKREDPILKDMPTQLVFRVENGVRNLAPYWSVYRSQTKGRWIGRTVVEVFQDEFLSYNPNYAIAALRLGRILVNGKQVTKLDYRLRGNDVISHVHHRHEHPILDKPIKVIEENENMLVVNKPSSMPVHACGQYKVNTVLGLLWKMHGISGLRVLHRLDRVTSGVLMFAKNLETDVEAKRLIQSGTLKKEYVCKVGGRFPDGKQLCEQPIDVIVVSLGIQQVRPDGKACRSTFQRIWYDPDSNESVVLCRIESGRTHQIRVHLQFLGYPIKNDTVYNTDAWGPERGKNAQYGKSVEQLVENLKHDHSCVHWHEEKDPDYDRRVKEIAEQEELRQEEWNADDFKFTNRPEIDPICLFCHVQKRKPPMEYFQMPLHCWRYTSNKWSYTAELPEWAWPPPTNAEVVPNLIDVKSNPERVLDFVESEECQTVINSYTKF